MRGLNSCKEVRTATNVISIEYRGLWLFRKKGDHGPEKELYMSLCKGETGIDMGNSHKSWGGGRIMDRNYIRKLYRDI